MILIQNIKTTPMYGVRALPLTQGRQALVDPWIYPELVKNKWSFRASGCNGHPVAVRGFGPRHNKASILLHRQITNCPAGMVVDHINGDSLDNRGSNLRICSDAQNKRNRKAISGKFKGVTKDARHGRYLAFIEVDNTKHALGRYKDETEAALAYDSAARILHGEFAWLNFPMVPSRFSSIDSIKDNGRINPKVSASGYRGVHFAKARGDWRAYGPSGKDGSRKHLGYFKSAESARDAYLKYTRAG